MVELTLSIESDGHLFDFHIFHLKIGWEASGRQTDVATNNYIIQHTSKSHSQNDAFSKINPYKPYGNLSILNLNTPNPIRQALGKLVHFSSHNKSKMFSFQLKILKKKSSGTTIQRNNTTQRVSKHCFKKAFRKTKELLVNTVTIPTTMANNL